MERYHTKARVWIEIKTIRTIWNNVPVISNINKLNKREAAKRISTFNFSTLHTKKPHDELIQVLHEITQFVFKGEKKDDATIYSSGAF